ncbi:MAG: hypothetical protein IJE89_03325 [Bacilli bacterium]|nr:hypothetical protein [Bacilli bacterium]
MNKISKYLSIIIPIILLIALAINILKYYTSFSDNKNIVKDSNSYQEKININNKKNEELVTEINKIKTEKEDKIWEYERWIKWNQEIKEKIN